LGADDGETQREVSDAMRRVIEVSDAMRRVINFLFRLSIAALLVTTGFMWGFVVAQNNEIARLPKTEARIRAECQRGVVYPREPKLHFPM
jgi:hypothetical protein